MNQQSRSRGSEHGGALYMFIFSLTIIFLVMGLSVDLGTSFVGRSGLSKAVDAGVLAGARYTQAGDNAMRQQAIQVATANYPSPDSPVTYDVLIDSPATDAKRVRMTASSGRPSYFAKAMGRTSIEIDVAATATRSPLDLSLVLDLSHSMYQSGAINDLRDAASNFLGYFDDSLDQLGLVTFSTWAEERMQVKKNFQSQGQSIISGLTTYTDTNIQEALRISKAQIDAAPSRPTARKAVVLVTDGMPTAYRDDFELLDPFCQQFDGVIASFITGSIWRGLFSHNNGQKLLPHVASCDPKLWASNSSILPSPIPAYILDDLLQVNLNGQNIRAIARDKAEAKADAILDADYTLYTIVINDALHPGVLQQLLAFAGDITNSSGIPNPLDPRGDVFFAENNSDIDGAFADLANRIVARLTE